MCACKAIHTCGCCYCCWCRQLTAALPSLDPVPNDELLALAHLHLNSAVCWQPMMTDSLPACRFCCLRRQLTAALPDLDPVPNHELPNLAHLHLDSAGQLMATLKLLVPEAFQGNSTEPSLNAILAVSGPAATMVSVLIDLQLFHLNRARDITAHMRARIAQKRANVQQQMQNMVTVSSGSGSTDDDLVQSLE